MFNFSTFKSKIKFANIQHIKWHFLYLLCSEPGTRRVNISKAFRKFVFRSLIILHVFEDTFKRIHNEIEVHS